MGLSVLSDKASIKKGVECCLMIKKSQINPDEQFFGYYLSVS